MMRAVLLISVMLVLLGLVVGDWKHYPFPCSCSSGEHKPENCNICRTPVSSDNNIIEQLFHIPVRELFTMKAVLLISVMLVLLGLVVGEWKHYPFPCSCSSGDHKPENCEVCRTPLFPNISVSESIFQPIVPGNIDQSGCECEE
ncbi:hypothetical protein GE061_008032 [Apolygus lucorum]|uniref:Uncharacterized protein n=1 Tax=Apolygus lucorum TaxID=248454 RepID=A0A6A4ISN7_APOLU|nr:hypothetical protein GE061_008032 [Apolygus lucorum]